MARVVIVRFDDDGNLHEGVEVTQEELGVECWLPARFVGGSCDRYYICKYAVKANCKTGPSRTAREAVEHDQLEEGEEVREDLVCALCGGMIELQTGDSPYRGDEGTSYEREPICDTCFDEDLCEPCATIYFGADHEEPCMIGTCRNETEGAFRVSWHSTDAWRGYYQLESDTYVELFTDAILSSHESEAMLKDLHDRLLERFEAAGIDFARAFCRSSNVFFTSLEIWVKRDFEQVLTAHAILSRIKEEVNYDDPLYSTGILVPRETLDQIKGLLKGKYSIEKDNDLWKLAVELGERLVEEVQEAANAL